MARRSFDVVLLGATGFTGALTARYLADHAPQNLRWAIAGRTKGKLEAARDELGTDLPLLNADVRDAGSMRALAESARVVITTVGPYTQHGEAVVAACADAGTDYVDLTGEPEFVDLSYLRHHARAVQTGARLVHCCGFDSVPHDLGALFTVGQFPDDVPLRVRGYVRAAGAFSAGTVHSAITAFSRARQSAGVARQRRAAEAASPSGTRWVRAETGRIGRTPAGVTGGWAVPLPTIDPQIVTRSARALPQYGPDFRYGHFAVIRHLPVVAGTVAGTGALFGLAQLPPARRLLLSRSHPGDGPSAERRARGWFAVRFVGDAASGERVVTEVVGGDPGYEETAKMLAESALCLAFDELPETSGQVTTAVAMGDALTRRLQRAGIRFSVLRG